MPELGNKHECSDCGTKYYDLGKSDAVCPNCGTDGDAEAPAEAKSKKKTAKKKAAKKKTAKKKTSKAK